MDQHNFVGARLHTPKQLRFKQARPAGTTPLHHAPQTPPAGTTAQNQFRRVR